MNEANLVQQALSSYEKLTGGNASVRQLEKPMPGKKDRADVQVDLQYGGNNVQLAAEVKDGPLSSSALGMLKQQMEATGAELLITGYVPTTLAESLRALHLNYLDAAGNMYLNLPGILLLVQGQKKTQVADPEPVKLFQPAGLRVIYQLIGYPQRPADPAPLQLPLRELAERAGVSLGSVHKALADLEQLGFVLRLNEKEKRLANRPELMKRWMVAYGETLRPRLYQGSFRFATEKGRQSWRELPLDTAATRWGGEPAGALYTGHIKPERFTLYTTEPTGDLMRRYRLLPQAEGEVEVLTYPAKQLAAEDHSGRPSCVPPLLAYADLMTSTDPRNHETALRLSHELLSYLA